MSEYDHARLLMLGLGIALAIAGEPAAAICFLVGQLIGTALIVVLFREEHRP